MLVLSRKHQEQIRIGEDIKITVLQVKGKTVRIGIEAPPNIRVLRAELPRHPEIVREFVESDESTTEDAELSESVEEGLKLIHSNVAARRPLSAIARSGLNVI